MQERENALNNCLITVLDAQPYFLTALAGDASFRKYYRLSYENKSRIVMDAPPDKETLDSFIQIAALLNDNKIRAPIVHAHNSQAGFAILDDFGDNLLLHKLSSLSQDSSPTVNYQHILDLYSLAITKLVQMQLCNSVALPMFDKNFTLQEMLLFKEWFVNAYLGLSLSIEEESLISKALEYISEEVDKQPKVFIHRDYHSRNIMLIENDKDLGIIDFQDAMQGPLTYDLVSLLKDCYIKWPRSLVLSCVSQFYELSSLAQQQPLEVFIKAFDLCGLQRHLKVLGIFCRLYLRDNKAGYLKDLPLTLFYVLTCLENYPELADFSRFIKKRCIP